MTAQITSTGTTTTLQNNGNTYMSVDTNDVVALENPLPVASGGTGSTTGAIYLQTPTATTSGTSHDYTSIPAGVKRIKVMISGLSSNGTSNMLIQLGDSGGVEASGYVSCSHVIATAPETSTVGFDFTPQLASGEFITGTMTLDLLNSATFLWVQTHMTMRTTGGTTYEGCGSKALSAELDRIRLTTTNGSDVFDAGLINISWEF